MTIFYAFAIVCSYVISPVGGAECFARVSPQFQSFEECSQFAEEALAAAEESLPSTHYVNTFMCIESNELTAS